KKFEFKGIGEKCSGSNHIVACWIKRYPVVKQERLKGHGKQNAIAETKNALRTFGRFQNKKDKPLVLETNLFIADGVYVDIAYDEWPKKGTNERNVVAKRIVLCSCSFRGTQNKNMKNAAGVSIQRMSSIESEPRTLSYDQIQYAKGRLMNLFFKYLFLCMYQLK
ncbi:hypothetical protein IFM89_022531, partial [Coptis chinensis]